jgi:putative flippase GtrA
MFPDRYQGLRSALGARVVKHPAWVRMTRTALSTRFTKYAVGSVIAFISSNVAFVLFYVSNASTTACSVAGFIAGAIPNWVLNRHWAWQRQGRPPARQIVGYIGVSIVVLVTTSAATGWTNAHVQSIPPHYGIRLLIVTASYVAVTVVLFAAKFGIYEYWVFSEHSRVRAAFRSLRPAPKAARNPRPIAEGSEPSPERSRLDAASAQQHS